MGTVFGWLMVGGCRRFEGSPGRFPRPRIHKGSFIVARRRVLEAWILPVAIVLGFLAVLGACYFCAGAFATCEQMIFLVPFPSSLSQV